MQDEKMNAELVSQLSGLSTEQMASIAAYLQELTGSQTKSAEIHDQYLTFWCNRQQFAIGIKQVIQIVQMAEITPIPEFPRYMRGVLSLRGEIFPVMDLRLRLGAETAEDDAKTCIIIIRINGSSFGLIVDGVNDVTTIDDQDICPPPKHNGHEVRYLAGMVQRERVILVLNMDHILSEAEIGRILEASAQMP